ncbi:MAG TPA: ABC transporter permease, partial [Acidobacteriota bacterium]|nr:ABC transporter permease [Acidobacteriota bacterium]
IVEIAPTGDMKGAMQFRVASIYEEKADPYLVPLRRNLIKMHLPDLERLTGRIDELSLVSLQVRKGVDTSNLAARLNAESIGFTAFSATEMMRRTSTTFEVVSRFHRAIAMITMTAGAVFIFALVVMRVEDQRKNLAILSITGISKKTVLKSLLLESTIFAFIASIMGVLLGYAAAAMVNLRYQHFYQTNLTFAEVTPSILLQALSVSFLLGIISGTFAWFRLRRLAILAELGR